MKVYQCSSKYNYSCDTRALLFPTFQTLTCLCCYKSIFPMQGLDPDPLSFDIFMCCYKKNGVGKGPTTTQNITWQMLSPQLCKVMKKYRKRTKPESRQTVFSLLFHLFFLWCTHSISDRLLDLPLSNKTWDILTVTQVGTRSHLLTSSTRCLCGFSFFMYFSMYLDRVPWGSRASSTCMQCIQCLILLKNNTAHTFFTNKWQVCYHIPSYAQFS